MIAPRKQPREELRLTARTDSGQGRNQTPSIIKLGGDHEITKGQALNIWTREL